MISRQIPLPSMPRLQGLWTDTRELLQNYLGTTAARLTNWVQTVSDTVTSIILTPTVLVPVPDGTTTTFTVPLTIQTDAQGVPQALLVVGGTVVAVSPQDPPPAGHWVLQQTMAGQQIVLGTAPKATDAAFFAFLVARRP
jgi:hypothetical protein